MTDIWIDESIKDMSFDDIYELGKSLGSGPLGTVHMCQHKGTNQNWAVKIINKETVKVSCSQVGLLLTFNNDNIIRVKEIYETNEDIKIVMELVTGGELYNRIVTSGTYSEMDVSKAISEIATALEYLHMKGEIHRNLKPQNILYENNSDSAKLKVGDFSISDVTSKAIYGSAVYYAPETLRLHVHSPASDMWAVGVVAYLLLCGSEPFDSKDESALYKNILKCSLEFDDAKWRNISENAKDLILKLLVLEPKKRLTATQVLNHPWVKGKAASIQHMEDAQQRMKDFNLSHKISVNDEANENGTGEDEE